ncbi:MAG: ABC transporter permease [Enterocloster asparagiformis]|nr:ABC transporter permease [Enterocloster asparagiformis]
MKQILTMIRLDTHLIFRDKVIWYVLVFPAIIGIILILVSGRIGDDTPTLAISPDLPQTALSSLEKVANLDIQANENSVLQRVNAFDNVAGITWKNGVVNVLFQGNEGLEFQNRTTAFVNAALNTQLPDIRLVNANTSKDFIVQIIMAALFLAPALVGGTVSGFLIVEEKENGLTRGYQIAPIQFSSYIGARSLLASIIGVISMTTLCFIFGTVNKLGMLAFILLCSLPLFGVITILFGSIAKDKISCIAMFKILVIIFLVLPLSSAFVPTRFHGIFYPLPMYWQFQSVLHVLNGSLNLRYCGITALSGILMLILITLIFHNKIQKI